jgi:hypothetical protein
VIGREKIVEYLSRQLVGPSTSDNEILTEDPLRYYASGILYPHLVVDREEDVDDTEYLDDDEAFSVDSGEVVADDDELGTDQNITSVDMTKPSAFGLTFRTDSELLLVTVRAARYQPQRLGRKKEWTRLPLDEQTVEIGADTRGPVIALSNQVQLVSRWRKMEHGLRTVTVAVTKNRTGPIGEDRHPKAEDCLFQVELEIRLANGKFYETPPRPGVAGGPDERRFELQYRERRTFARGHSCAAEWDVSIDPRHATSVSISHLPVREVFPTIPRSTNDPACDISFLAFSRDGVISALENFVGNYRSWIDEVGNSVINLESRHQQTAMSIIKDLYRAHERMQEGCELLRKRQDLLEVFQLANRVILHQMIQSAAANNKEPVNYKDEKLLRDGARKWRPFQLAFLLLVLPSLVDDKHPDRDIVDLIWFQTGGGKTEAYLLVAAMEIMLRRTRLGDRRMGTTVLMRYTLRLLTAQQFERVCRMICALEIARTENKRLFPGDERFSAGLWVGRENSPNTFRRVDELLDSDDFDGAFGLRRCPWCGVVFERESFSHTNITFRIRCVNQLCPFSDSHGLPVDTVDESLYNNPPSLLLGTVDKFAQMAWESRVRSFFGKVGPPPSLVIQDELHLLGGALGSVYGLYEAAIDALCLQDGALPKVIASTATIRDADKQIRALYGRTTEIFPPSGLSIDDSYFAQTTTEGSRLFVGVLSANKTATTSIIRTSAVLAQAPVELRDELTPDELDAYWTQVIYHSSLKEEGRTFSFLGDDIPIRIEEISQSPTRMRHLASEVIEELTSSVQSWRIPLILDRMAVPYGSKDSDALAAVTCTNMLSVGVDVPRLGLMIVHGQPKSTAEYIQATSRIGRQVSHPGLIIAHFRALNPRDMSHYEMFTSYHDAFYRFVEPASVTPMSLPCRQRALHAALVSVIRQWSDGVYSESARVDFLNPQVVSAVTTLRSRLEARCREDENEVGDHLDRLISEWQDKVQHTRQLTYRKSVGADEPLLITFDDPLPSGANRPWRTLMSMRSVDVDVKIKVEGRA